MTNFNYDMIRLKIQNSKDEIANLDQHLQQSKHRTSRPAGFYTVQVQTSNNIYNKSVIKN